MALDALARLWYRPPRLAYVLVPIAAVYRSAVALRRMLYRTGMLSRTRLRVPVVVVGNLTVGGTGKTPLTLWLAEKLAAKGLRPGVICKSYGASATAPSLVVPGDEPRDKGDEAALLASRLSCPVWSGPDRVATALAMLAHEESVDVVVCDDGLQHYALERDCEIALVDAMRGFGNGFVLPAGPLREPPSRLRSVHAVVVHGNETVSGIPAHVPSFRMALHGAQLRNIADPGRVVAPSELAGKKLAAVAGIGNPQRFFEQLRGLGLSVDAHAFPDHHRFRHSELEALRADAVLMTEKDAIKCARFKDPRLWMLPVSAMLSDELLGLVLQHVGPGRRTQ